MNIDKTNFIETFGANHILAVEGNIKKNSGHLANCLTSTFFYYDV